MSSVTHTNLDAFVRYSIRATSDCPDEPGLQVIFDRMTSHELQSFWVNFTSSRAFSVATTTVPDWKTREQRDVLGCEILNYAFQPKEKDVDGKYIVVRSDLEEHIKKYLFKYISDERRLEKQYRMRPLFDRIHAKIGISIVLVLYLGIFLGIGLFVLSIMFHFNFPSALFKAGEVGIGVLFMLYVIVMPLLRAILRACGLLKDTHNT